ncbi:hypothetical protein C8Q74DRAFT_1162808, partial [Fomes fomentarius]
GSQKYHPHHLCKHLVQAVALPPAKFWLQVYRRRTIPIYRHPVLRDITQPNATTATYHDADDGTISDGDDHVWLGDREQLK